MHNLTVLTCLPPPALVVHSNAESAAHHLWGLGCWAYLHPNRGHSNIMMQLQKLDPIFGMDNDVMGSPFNFEPKYRVIMLAREEQARGPVSPPAVKGLIYFTDGSRTWRRAGAGVYGQSLGRGLITSLGRYARVFQAEIYAILACIYKIQINIRSEKYIRICSKVKQLWKPFRLLKRLYRYGSAKGC